MTDLRMIPVAEIDDGGRLRAVRPDHRLAMAETISQTGQLQAIEVIETEKGYRLVFGAKRLAGVLALGGTEIRAEVRTEDEFAGEAEIGIRSIVENFGQFAMTALERAISLARWKDLYETQHPVAKHGGKRPKSLDNDQVVLFTACFTEVAAEALDVSPSTVEKSVKIARGIPADIQERLQHHHVASRQSELLLLAAEPPARQAAIVGLILNEPVQTNSVTDAIALLDRRAGPARPLAIYEKLQQRFATLKANEQERFFDLNADAIERWMARRIAAQSQKNAA